MLQSVLSITQVILGVLLTALVLLQQKGAGMGAAFGGSSNVYSTRRGVDKVLFQATIVTSILFFGLGLTLVVLA